MKKRIIATVLFLILLLPFSAVADTSAVLDDTVSSSGGQTTIRWKSSGSAPAGGYKVIVMAENPMESGSIMQLAGESTGNSVTTGLLAPEKTYEVYLVDSNYDIIDYHEYTMPSVPVFEDGLLKNTSVKVSIEMRQTDINGKYRKINAFKSSDMITGITSGSAYPCMKFQMQMPQLAYERSFYVQLVFESPNGYTFTDKASDVTFERVNNGYQTVWWEYAGWDFFDQLYRQTDSIPAGEYKMHLYWDGCWVKTTTFNVR